MELRDIAIQIDRNPAQARDHFSKITSSQLNRDQLPTYAMIARKLGEPLKGLSALRDFVRDPSGTNASPSEIAEYSMCLSRIGSSGEAERRLLGLKKESFELRDFYLGLNYMSIWDYETASEYFEDQLKSEEISINERIFCHLNLAACYNFYDQFPVAIENVEKAKNLTEKDNHRVLAMAHEILGTSNYLEKNFDLAKSNFELATHHSDGKGPVNDFVKKWRLYIDLQENFESTVSQFLKFIKEMHTKKNWELVRDMNYEFAKFKGDTKRLSEIYFGTPYASFKERMNAEGFKTDKTHWNCPLEFGLDHHEAISIDFTEGRIGKRSFKMDDGLTSQLLIGLTEDLFRPTYYTSLYEELYPNEEFESDLSRDKLNKVLKRARQFIKKNEMPLNLNFKDGFIWLSGSSPVSVVKRSYSERRSQLSTILRKVERECGLEFKSSDAKKLLEVSTGKLHSILTSAEEKNLISKSGKGKNTIYKMNIPKR